MSSPTFVIREDDSATGTNSTQGVSLVSSKATYQMAGANDDSTKVPSAQHLHGGQKAEQNIKEAKNGKDVANGATAMVMPVPMAPPGKRPDPTSVVPAMESSVPVSNAPVATAPVQAAALYGGVPDVLPQSVTSQIESRYLEQAAAGGALQGSGFSIDMVHQVLSGMFGDGQAARMLSRACKATGVSVDAAIDEQGLYTLWSAVIAKIPDRAKRSSLDIEFREIVSNITAR